jgi:hypothetical protein
MIPLPSRQILIETSSRCSLSGYYNDMNFRVFFIGLSFLFFYLFIAPFPAHGASSKPIKLILRYDDYIPCYTKATEIHVAGQRYSKIIDQHVINMAERHNISISLGVIPLPQGGGPFSDKSCSEIFLTKDSRKKIEIVQHGYSHSIHSVTNNRVNSEFAGRPYSEQLSLIKDGRNALERSYGVQVKSFIPPWNSYDKATVDALNILGFKIVSTDLRSGPGWVGDIPKSIPVTCELKDINQAINIARKQAQKTSSDVFIVCLFH